MVDGAINESKKVMYECAERYAQEKEITVDRVQLVLGLSEAKENTYTMCIDYKKIEAYTILQVLNTKIPFGMYAMLAPPFINKALLRHAETLRITHDKISCMCVPTEIEMKENVYGVVKKKKNIRLFLYNGNDFVREIEFEELFNQEDSAMPKMG